MTTEQPPRFINPIPPTTATEIADPAPSPSAPDPEAPPPAAADPNRLPLMLWTLDLPWPDADDRHFAFDIPHPCMFQRAHRAEVSSPMQGGRRKPMLRLVWLVAVGGNAARQSFVLQRPGDVVTLAVDGSGPKLLGTVVSAHGDPIALWHLPAERVADVPAAEDVPPPELEQAP